MMLKINDNLWLLLMCTVQCVVRLLIAMSPCRRRYREYLLHLRFIVDRSPWLGFMFDDFRMRGSVCLKFVCPISSFRMIFRTFTEAEDITIEIELRWYNGIESPADLAHTFKTCGQQLIDDNKYPIVQSFIHVPMSYLLLVLCVLPNVTVRPVL